jgi:hypothetical protein
MLEELRAQEKLRIRHMNSYNIYATLRSMRHNYITIESLRCKAGKRSNATIATRLGVRLSCTLPIGCLYRQELYLTCPTL